MRSSPWSASLDRRIHCIAHRAGKLSGQPFERRIRQSDDGDLANRIDEPRMAVNAAPIQRARGLRRARSSWIDDKSAPKSELHAWLLARGRTDLVLQHRCGSDRLQNGG